MDEVDDVNGGIEAGIAAVLRQALELGPDVPLTEEHFRQYLVCEYELDPDTSLEEIELLQDQIPMFQEVKRVLMASVNAPVDTNWDEKHNPSTFGRIRTFVPLMLFALGLDAQPRKRGQFCIGGRGIVLLIVVATAVIAAMYFSIFR